MASNVLHQVMNSQSFEETMSCPKQLEQHHQQAEKRQRPQPDQSLKCPRCDSTNTKFCYYNNYSLSQPRYFCKGCRRYWTQGGTLRNVPVGGGCRKNRRSSSSFKRFQDNSQLTNNTTHTSTVLSALPDPSLPFDPSDLALALTRLHSKPVSSEQHDYSQALTVSGVNSSFLDILRGGFFDNGYQSFGYGGEGYVGGGAVSVGELGTEEMNMNGSMDVGVNVFGESGREMWGAVGAPWHGLVNSSLM